MNHVKAILEIAEANYREEMDSWYCGPCDKVFSIAKEFTDKDWDILISSSKRELPDLARVFLAHSFFERRGFIGKSVEFITFQACKCASSEYAYLIVQYMGSCDLSVLPGWLTRLYRTKLEIMKSECDSSCSVILEKLLGEVGE